MESGHKKDVEVMPQPRPLKTSKKKFERQGRHTGGPERGGITKTDLQGFTNHRMESGHKKHVEVIHPPGPLETSKKKN